MSRLSTTSGIVALALATVAAGIGFALDVPTSTTGEINQSSHDLVTTLPPASAGSLTCPGTADKDTTPSIVVQSVDPDNDSIVNVRYLKTKGAAPKDERFELKAGERKILSKTSAAVLDWAGAPVQASVFDSVGGLNSRVNCATSATDQWDLVGFDTTLGSVSTLVLANPTTTPAVANLSIATPSGPVNLTLATGIEIPALEQQVIDLSEFVPNVDAFSVRVSTSAGRVVASGELVRREIDTASAQATLGKVTGRARVVGVPVPTDQAIIPALGAQTAEVETATQQAEAVAKEANVPSADPSASATPTPTPTPTPAEAGTSGSKDHQLIIANPNEDQVTVVAKASAPIPGEGVLAAPITVPGGSVASIKLGDISTLPNPGLVAHSEEGLPIVAAVRTTGKDLDITNGVNGAATDWVLTGVEGAHVALSNPGNKDTEVTLTIDKKDRVVTVGANSVTLVPSPTTGALAISAQNPIVASLRTVGAGWSIAGAAIEDLTGGGLAPKAVRTTTKITTPARDASAELEIIPPVELVPGGTRASELTPQDGDASEGETSSSEPTPTPDASGSTSPSPGTSEQPLPVPSGLPAPTDSPASEEVNENIFG